VLYKGYASVSGSVALGMIRMPVSTRIGPWGKTQVDGGSGGLMSESYQTWNLLCLHSWLILSHGWFGQIYGYLESWLPGTSNGLQYLYIFLYLNLNLWCFVCHSYPFLVGRSFLYCTVAC
jgi:hypothetical protein